MKDENVENEIKKLVDKRCETPSGTTALTWMMQSMSIGDSPILCVYLTPSEKTKVELCVDLCPLVKVATPKEQITVLTSVRNALSEILMSLQNGE